MESLVPPYCPQRFRLSRPICRWEVHPELDQVAQKNLADRFFALQPKTEPINISLLPGHAFPWFDEKMRRVRQIEEIHWLFGTNSRWPQMIGMPGAWI